MGFEYSKSGPGRVALTVTNLSFSPRKSKEEPRARGSRLQRGVPGHKKRHREVPFFKLLTETYGAVGAALIVYNLPGFKSLSAEKTKVCE